MATAGPQRPVVHLELHTADLQRARDLYSELCGWQPERIETDHGSYTALDMGNGIGGGIVECRARRPIWLPYVEVRDIHQVTRVARGLGAHVLVDSREGPAGWRTVIATETGGEIAFWQQKR
jgi:uncharacterized protein